MISDTANENQIYIEYPAGTSSMPLRKTDPVAKFTWFFRNV